MSEFARELTDLIRNLAEDAGDKVDDYSRGAQVRELGLAGIGMPEEQGGSGGSLADLMVVIRELARAGVSTPIVEASTAAYAIGAAPREGFETIVVMPDWDVLSNAVTASLRRSAIRGHGQRAGHRDSLLGRDGPAGGGVGHRRARPRHCRLALWMCAPRRRFRRAHTAADLALPEVIDRLALARSAALLGSAWGAYELTRRYVMEREQFGAPLIKIPAVSTTLAQMAVRIRSAQSALDRATTACADAHTPALRRFGAVSAARISAATAASLVARTSHQLHGAVGITAEYGLHRYTSKLWALRDADESQLAYCRRLGARVRAEGEIQLWENISA